MTVQKFFNGILNGIGMIAAVLLAICVVALLALGAVTLVKTLLVAVFS